MANSKEINQSIDPNIEIAKSARAYTRRGLRKPAAQLFVGVGSVILGAKSCRDMQRIDDSIQSHVNEVADESLRKQNFEQLSKLRERAIAAFEQGDQQTIFTLLSSPEYQEINKREFMYQVQAESQLRKQGEVREQLTKESARGFQYALGGYFVGTAGLMALLTIRSINPINDLTNWRKKWAERNTRVTREKIFHPDWHEQKIADADRMRFEGAVLQLPPIGGKVVVFSGHNSEYTIDKIPPTLTAEEQVDKVAALRQEGKLGQDYVHQLTVQGRLPDEFKYAAVALILSSPYVNDWEKPFFEAPWGRIAPLVHDGGNTEEQLSPLWRNVQGRTDFLYRSAKVWEQGLEHLESLTPAELVKLSVDRLANARFEQRERERLLTEAKAYQRLALCLHAKQGTVPNELPQKNRAALTTYWDEFRDNMDMLLRTYNVDGVVRVPWFYQEPRTVSGWSSKRYEAEWDPIKQELISLEQTRQKQPMLFHLSRTLLQDYTDKVDHCIGFK